MLQHNKTVFTVVHLPTGFWLSHSYFVPTFLKTQPRSTKNCHTKIIFSELGLHWRTAKVNQWDLIEKFKSKPMYHQFRAYSDEQILKLYMRTPKEFESRDTIESLLNDPGVVLLADIPDKGQVGNILPVECEIVEETLNG